MSVYVSKNKIILSLSMSLSYTLYGNQNTGDRFRKTGAGGEDRQSCYTVGDIQGVTYGRKI